MPWWESVLYEVPFTMMWAVVTPAILRLAARYLKPFDDQRFGKTLARARKYLSAQNGNSDRLMTLLDELRHSRQEPVRFAIKSPGRVFFVRLEEIDWVEAADNYALLHVAG